MDTRPLRIFLLGTTLAVGAVVGLAPASEAKYVPSQPGVVIDAPGVTLPPIEEVPPATELPPGSLDPCKLIDCDHPPILEVDPCILVPEDCPPPTTEQPPTTRPPRTPPPEDTPVDEPEYPTPSHNPDVVYRSPSFTG